VCWQIAETRLEKEKAEFLDWVQRAEKEMSEVSALSSGVCHKAKT